MPFFMSVNVKVSGPEAQKIQKKVDYLVCARGPKARGPKKGVPRMSGRVRAGTSICMTCAR